MDALMSFSSHLFWIHDALHMQKLFEIWYDNLKWSSHDNSLKGTYYASFYKMQIGLGCPQNMSVKFQLKIPNISFILTAGKCLGRV